LSGEVSSTGPTRCVRSPLPLVLTPEDGRCRVRGTGILNSLHYVRQTAGRDGVKAVSRRLAEADLARIDGMRRTKWYPFALHCRVLRAVDAELGSRAELTATDGGRSDDFPMLHDLGYHSASQDFPTLFKPAYRMGRPGWILEVATRLWRVFHGEGRWEIERLPNQIVARQHDWDEPDEAFCASFVGYVTALLELSGAHDVDAGHVACAALGAPHCVFTVRWS
jgi:hypothetical protein